MLYVRIVNANEIGIRKGGSSKRAGSFLMVSKKCLNFLPKHNPAIPDSTLNVQYISPNGQEMGLVDYVWHNKALHEEKSTRNEHRLYFSRELDPQNYIEPGDIVVMKKVNEQHFNGIKLFLFKEHRDKEYNIVLNIIGNKTHSLYDKLNIDYIDNYHFSPKDFSDSLFIDDKVSNINSNVELLSELNDEDDIITPSAASMIENLRSLGYSTEEAIADIIDNSISANATRIDISMKWHGRNSFIAIQDNGNSMDEEELIQAMRPGSKNPNAERASTDLGRFGMGLKSASFSLGTELTVFAYKNGLNSLRRWDLNYVSMLNKWKILKTQSSSSKYNYKIKDTSSSGTVILIENLDRLLSINGSGTIISDDDFYSILGKVKFHLSLVFHRYINQKKLSIYVNERKLEYFDPHFGNTDINKNYFTSINKNISISSFITPREIDLPIPTKRLLKRVIGFTQLQGIYIYREDRLISYGGWLNLGRRHSMKINDDYALGRVIVELKNSEDKNWQIDIKKSTAFPPINMLPVLNRAAETVRKLSQENIKQSRTHIKKTENYDGVWSQKETGLKVDRANSLYRILASDSQVGQKFMEYIKTLEDKIPQ